MSYCFMSCILAIVMTLYFRRQNTIKARQLAEHGVEYTAEEKEAREDEGEMVPWFKFTT
jgi:hypothetical protein